MTDGPLKEDAAGFVQSTWNRYRSRACPHCPRSNPTKYSGEPAGGAVQPFASAGSIAVVEDVGESRYSIEAFCPASIAVRSNTATPIPPHVPSSRNWFIVM